MNSQIKKEFTVSRGFYLPVYPSVASAIEPTAGSLAFDSSTGSLLVSNGENWEGGAATTPATPTTLGTVYGTTSQSSVTALGYNTGTAAGQNVFIGFRAGNQSNAAETRLTFVGANAGTELQNGSNKTVVGTGDLSGDGENQNSTGIGFNTLIFSNTGAGNNAAVGTRSIRQTLGSQNCGIGASTINTSTSTSNYSSTVAIGLSRITSVSTASGLINIGANSTSWDSGASTNTIYIGNGNSIPTGTTNVIALGSGSFASSAVASNTFAIADDITQWRSFGLSVSASANTLQINPLTGIITQAASSRRFKENIRQPENVPSLSDCTVKTYEVDGETSHGLISEDIPEFYATFDKEGRNGVSMTRIIMQLLSQVQELSRDIEEKKKSMSL
ncbi:hypothetical protein GMAR_ORF270 [Golden Marseillevirus]|uniref:hypothetical protein n=1 Tax=Golden Marseillevirus TaxID=1720526 RepID=UPI000877AC0D|nr:hypothetical protein GMAR_ORF270 [Golden Marseillevirus]ALX27644.1 hypothetical protein GMAR_ORF270 [Golden Marseillevirus]